MKRIWSFQSWIPVCICTLAVFPVKAEEAEQMQAYSLNQDYFEKEDGISFLNKSTQRNALGFGDFDIKKESDDGVSVLYQKKIVDWELGKQTDIDFLTDMKGMNTEGVLNINTHKKHAFNVNINIWKPIFRYGYLWGKIQPGLIEHERKVSNRHWIDEIFIRVDAKSEKSPWELLAYSDQLNDNNSQIGIGYQTNNDEFTWLKYLLAKAFRTQTQKKQQEGFGWYVSKKSRLNKGHTNINTFVRAGTGPEDVFVSPLDLAPLSNHFDNPLYMGGTGSAGQMQLWDLKTKSALIQRRVDMNEL